ncbi:MAG: hypothetical protein IJH78_00700 [Clostridia bacterium]|nr:hypothetical protein [Clostridia bacterium]
MDDGFSGINEQARKDPALHNGRNKYNNCMGQQIGLIISAEWANAFEREAVSFGKSDASFFRQFPGALRSAVWILRELDAIVILWQY